MAWSSVCRASEQEGRAVLAMEITLVGVLVPAAVAVATTLLVEYAAKPSLEARKERILDQDRRRRTALRGVERVSYLGGRLLALREAPGVEYGRERGRAIAAELGPLIETAMEDLDVSGDPGEWWFGAMVTVRAHTLLVRDDRIAAGQWDEFSASVDVIDLIGSLLVVPRWRVIRRKRLTAEASAAHGQRAAMELARTSGGRALEVPPESLEQPSTAPGQ
jgi:hypothetical protein